MKSKNFYLLVILLIGLLYGLIVAVLPKDVFWIIDGGNKFIQIQSMAMSKFPDFSVHYPAKDIDPGLDFFPYCGHHYKVIEGSIYAVFPFYFSLVSLLPYLLLGIQGIYILPVLASLLCLLITHFLLRQVRYEDKYGLGLLLLAFCSPLFFYSLTFWEHSLAAMLVACSFLFILKSRVSEKQGWLLLASGFLLGISTILREEGSCGLPFYVNSIGFTHFQVRT